MGAAEPRCFAMAGIRYRAAAALPANLVTEATSAKRRPALTQSKRVDAHRARWRKNHKRSIARSRPLESESARPPLWLAGGGEAQRSQSRAGPSPLLRSMASASTHEQRRSLGW